MLTPRPYEMQPLLLQPIGRIHSPFRDRFSVPRQAGLAARIPARIELLPPFNLPEAVIGLDRFSHLWIQFLFHLNPRRDWQPMVRPPRLGGNRKLGVFATRSPFRPNPIGLSAVQLNSIQTQANQVWLHILGADLVDGTPVLDIKPYLPYADALDAQADFATTPPEAPFQVRFSPLAERQLADSQLVGPQGTELRAMLEDLLRYDHRPAFHADDPERDYATRLYHLDIHWQVRGTALLVTKLRRIDDQPPTSASQTTDQHPSG